MIRNVTWVSESVLPCSPTANVILCTDLFTISGQLVNTFENSCPGEFVYHFTYEDEDLPEGFLEDEGPLADSDINSVICEDCLTQWARQLVNKAFEFVVSDGTDEITLPSGGPLEVVGGAGINVSIVTPNQLEIDLEISTDTDNQLVVGSDGNPYVSPALFSPDGWYPISDSWTFTSATTVNVPAGALLRYAKGDKVKFDNAFTKYFYVIDVADTLLTVLAGDTYGVSNSTISNIALSKSLTPVGFPSSFNFLTIYSGFSVLPTQVRRYSITGRTVKIDVSTTASGTSNATIYTMTAPIVSEAGSLTFISGGNQGYDNGTYLENVFAQIPTASNVITLSPEGAAVAWTAAGDKSANFNLEYYF